MALFRRHRTVDPSPERIPGLRDAMFGQGWTPAPPRPFDGNLEDICTHIALAMHGIGHPGGTPYQQDSNFHDAYAGQVDGRRVTVANAFLKLDVDGTPMPFSFRGTSICAAELPTMVLGLVVQPRRMRHQVARSFHEIETGDPVFDERYVVRGGDDLAGQLMTPDIRQLMSARDDWVFVSQQALFGCVGRGAFTTVDEVRQRVADVMAIVRAIPTTVMPDHIDRSVDDLMTRIAAVDDIDGALALLQSLSDDDRARLAASDTPLAVMADVRTPEEALQRFESLDQASRMQLLAMFSRSEGF
jgi:hypothetical protein